VRGAGAAGWTGEAPDRAARGWTRRRALLAGCAGAGLLALGGCGAAVRRQPGGSSGSTNSTGSSGSIGSTAAAGSASLPAAASEALSGVAARADYLYLTVLTGGMIGRKG